MLARTPAHRNELERDDVYLPRINRGEIIRETKILCAALLHRLTRARESQPLRRLLLFVNDQVIAARLTREISVNQFSFEQLVADRLSFDLGEFRIDGFVKDLLVFVRRFASPLLLASA